MDGAAIGVIGAVAGACAAGAIALIRDKSLREHELTSRRADRDDARADAIRERRENAYHEATVRLRAAQRALHRAKDALYGDYNGLDHPFSTKGSVDWAIDEADKLRGVQAEVDLVASPGVAGNLAEALEHAETMRWDLSMPEWDSASADRVVARFDACLDATLAEMRRDLEA